MEKTSDTFVLLCVKKFPYDVMKFFTTFLVKSQTWDFLQVEFTNIFSVLPEI